VTRRRSPTGRPAVAESGRVIRPLSETAYTSPQFTGTERAFGWEKVGVSRFRITTPAVAENGGSGDHAPNLPVQNLSYTGTEPTYLKGYHIGHKPLMANDLCLRIDPLSPMQKALNWRKWKSSV